MRKKVFLLILIVGLFSSFITLYSQNIQNTKDNISLYKQEMKEYIDEQDKVIDNFMDLIAGYKLGFISREKYLQRSSDYMKKFEEIDSKISLVKPPKKCEKTHELLIQAFRLKEEAFKNFMVKENDSEIGNGLSTALNIIYKALNTSIKEGCYSSDNYSVIVREFEKNLSLEG